MAVNKEEVERLDKLYERALENGCVVSLVDSKTIQEIEPHCRVGQGLFLFELGLYCLNCANCIVL